MENNESNSNIIYVTDDSFDTEVLKSSQPVLVDFWAPWCGPCKAIGPLLDEISVEQQQIRVAKVNVDENPESAKKFSVRAIPTMLMFKEGNVVGTKIGASTKADISAFISEYA